MTLNQLIAHYLEGSKVANGGRTTTAPGSKPTVFFETMGGEGYTEQVKARALGEHPINSATFIPAVGISDG